MIGSRCLLCPVFGKDDTSMLPPPPNNIGRHRSGNKPEGGRFYFTIADELHIPQSGAPRKLIYLQRLRFDKDDRVELRLGYYVIGKKKRMRGRWVWGQYATMLPVADFKRVIKKAKQKGWLN
jgi:hypothetical protein